MGKGKLLPYSRAHVRPFRPAWSWALPSVPSAQIRRTPAQLRSEMTYLLPAMRCVEERRHVILECLERSKLQEGVGKQFSGAGFVHRSRSVLPDHLLHIYQSVDAVAAESIARSSTDIFPIRRVFNLGKEYQSVWAKKQFVRRGRDEVAAKEGAPSGPFPYVDERAAVLRELTKAEIYKTRHRVNSDAHPKWALRTIRRRRRKALIRAKKRSISQESIRILQAKLLASQTPLLAYSGESNNWLCCYRADSQISPQCQCPRQQSPEEICRTNLAATELTMTRIRQRDRSDNPYSPSWTGLMQPTPLGRCLVKEHIASTRTSFVFDAEFDPQAMGLWHKQPQGPGGSPVGLSQFVIKFFSDCWISPADMLDENFMIAEYALGRLLASSGIVAKTVWLSGPGYGTQLCRLGDRLRPQSSFTVHQEERVFDF